MSFKELYLIFMILILLTGSFIYLKFKKGKLLIVIVALLANIIYITWRVTVIPSRGLSLVFGLALFLAELLGTIGFLNFNYFSSKRYKLKKKILDDPYGNDVPTVDILICTYNEPIDLLRKTMLAALELKYNKSKLNIYLCDDGRREAVKNLSQEYGVNYITREDNKGAKAGNINNAFKLTNGELVAILDADMIAKRNFLIKTVAYFENEKVAFVQVPQSYYNADMYQYNLKTDLPNEQDFFMRDIQEARASINSVLHVGTNAVFRREAVNSVGGFPTFSITEDMALGMKLQSSGYKSILVNEPLVLGLSATTLEESVKQRERWARGNVQVFKKDNPLFNRGLKWNQKIAYVDGLLYWFSSVQKMIYIICPLVYLLFGILTINSRVGGLLEMYLPYLLSQMVIIKIISPKNRSLKWSHYYETVMAPSISKAVLLELFSIKSLKKFNVTSKDVKFNKNYFNFRFAFPHVVLLTSTVISWLMAVKLIYDSGSLLTLNYIMLNILWSVYNSAGLIVAIKVANQKPIFRTTERVTIKEKMVLHCKSGSNNKLLIKNISDNGLAAEVLNGKEFELDDKVEIFINKTIVKGTVVRKHENLYGIKFHDISKEAMIEIMKIYIDNLKPYYELKRDDIC